MIQDVKFYSFKYSKCLLFKCEGTFYCSCSQVAIRLALSERANVLAIKSRADETTVFPGCARSSVSMNGASLMFVHYQSLFCWEIWRFLLSKTTKKPLNPSVLFG